MSAVSLSPRVTWLMARRFTTTERCTCANCAGSSWSDQFLQRRADQRLAGLARVAAPGDQRVLRVGAQVVDVVDRDQAQRLPDRRADPAQRRRAAAFLREPRRQLLQQRLGVRRRLRGAQALLQARHGVGQARRLHRLHQVVERALREGLDRVLVVGGDEHEVRAAADAVRRLDARQARHVHVEEADVGLQRLELLDRLAAVARLRDHLQLGPGLRELARQRLAQQRLVVGDQRGRARPVMPGSARREVELGADAVRLERGEAAAARRRRTPAAGARAASRGRCRGPSPARAGPRRCR